MAPFNIGVFVEPVSANLVGRMSYFEVCECGFEAVAIRACSEHTDFYRAIGKKP